MTKTHYSLREFATVVGVKAHRIVYAITNGYLTEPERIMNFRMFSEEDIAAAKEYFSRPRKDAKQRSE